ncbi:MAG: acetyl-CoA carboxylase biotin carboxyl carrier protein subunit [Silicimonas sp.]
MALEEVHSPVSGTVWKLEKTVGDRVSPSDDILIIESMKMEIGVQSPKDGKIVEIKAAEGEAVDEGDLLAIVET